MHVYFGLELRRCIYVSHVFKAVFTQSLVEQRACNHHASLCRHRRPQQANTWRRTRLTMPNNYTSMRSSQGHSLASRSGSNLKTEYVLIYNSCVSFDEKAVQSWVGGDLCVLITNVYTCIPRMLIFTTRCHRSGLSSTA